MLKKGDLSIFIHQSLKNPQSIFLEFKSTLIDRQFQKIKIKLLQQIHEIDGVVLYSCYVKKQKNMKEILKESVYITLLSNIINSIDETIDVIFDEFKNKKFEDSIVNTFMDFENVNSIAPRNSQEVSGLQFADNVCSVVRLYVTASDENDYFSHIESIVRSV